MGQKTNATIFRIGIKNNEWNSKYFEKNVEEFSLYNYQHLKIKKYLEQFLDKNGLLLHSYKFYFNTRSLNLFVSYYVTTKVSFFVNKINDNLKIKLNNITNKKTVVKKLKVKERLPLLKKYKRFISFNKFHYKKILKKNDFSEQLFKSLQNFISIKFNILLTFQNVNKGLSLKLSQIEKKILKRKLLSLRRYSRNPFFNDTINGLVISVRLKNSAQLLSKLISKQISNMKKHNYFLIFLKRVLTLFLTSNFSLINGIKIGIKGRFNKAPRARNRIILVGNLPIQTLNSNIKYYQTVSFTPNGTFGIKVWINENFTFKNVFTTKKIKI